MKDISKELFVRAQGILPGGVNSPVRAFGAVGGTPVFITRGKNAYLYDVDGNEYLDFLASWGVLILGHAHPLVVEAIAATARDGISFGAATEREILLAEMLGDAVPLLDMVRMVNSGTEATMSALRLARAFTNRDLVVKFDGCYHGHNDSLLVQAGSGAATLGIPGSQGVPPSIAALTLSLPYNDIESLRMAFTHYGERIACVIVEPVAGNMGVVKATRDFLKATRELTKKSGALLIFDEVISGFRFLYGCYQSLVGIEPDLICLGKIIGGGLPVGAFGGKKEIMSMLAPLGGVYQAGTLSGNPLAVAAGIATLGVLKDCQYLYEDIERKTFGFCQSLLGLFAQKGIAVRINQASSMFTCFFTDSEVRDFVSAKRADKELYAKFFHALLDCGIYFPPAQFEAAFVSFAHQDKDFTLVLERIEKALRFF